MSIINSVKRFHIKETPILGGTYFSFEHMSSDEMHRLLNYVFAKGYERGGIDMMEDNFTEVLEDDCDDYFSYYVNEILF